MSQRGEKGRLLNNERLEFLGDAMLGAAVGNIVYHHFSGKREGFLTSTRSKLVKRETLDRLAEELGLLTLLHSTKRSSTHNSHIGGNAFEALVGAIYLDRGYDACVRFVERRILKHLVNIDKVAYKETNFKSRLIEWFQKNRVKLVFRILKQAQDKSGSPVFSYAVMLEDIEVATGTGYSKKESQQQASKVVLAKLRKDPQFVAQIFASKQRNADETEASTTRKSVRSKMKESEVCVDPTWENLPQTPNTSAAKSGFDTSKSAPTPAKDAPSLSVKGVASSSKGAPSPVKDALSSTDEAPNAAENSINADKEAIISRAEDMAFAEQ